MPRAAAALVFGVLLSISSLAGAAELTGFGPIKFGMSKEEALSALEARGLKVKEVTERDNEMVVVYEIPFNNKRLGIFDSAPYSPLRVSQVFRNGRASIVSFISINNEQTPLQCERIIDYFTSIIKEKYNIEPFLSDSSGVLKEIAFVFPGESLITIVAIMPYGINDPTCQIEVTYFPPPENPIGF